jgi:molybdenum cofactor cytidylyltransferase
MPAAFRTHPELIRFPRVGRQRIAQLHLCAAALTPDLQTDFTHGLRILYDSRVIPAIVLAAGKSVRMGRPKATLPLDGDTFLSRIVRTFADAGIDDVVVVVGHDADAIVASFAQADRVVARARFVDNPQYEQGQLSSLLTGLQVVDRPGVVAVLMTLVDVPLVSPDTIRAVVDRYRQTHAPIVRPVRGEQHGHPVLIDRKLFDAIRRADPASGAKPIIRANVSAAGDVPVDDPGAFSDADTPEDYERLLRP